MNFDETHIILYNFLFLLHKAHCTINSLIIYLLSCRLTQLLFTVMHIDVLQVGKFGGPLERAFR
jgi:hypothetical protein